MSDKTTELLRERREELAAELEDWLNEGVSHSTLAESLALIDFALAARERLQVIEARAALKQQEREG